MLPVIEIKSKYINRSREFHRSVLSQVSLLWKWVNTIPQFGHQFFQFNILIDDYFKKLNPTGIDASNVISNTVWEVTLNEFSQYKQNFRQCILQTKTGDP